MAVSSGPVSMEEIQPGPTRRPTRSYTTTGRVGTLAMSAAGVRRAHGGGLAQGAFRRRGFMSVLDAGCMHGQHGQCLGSRFSPSTASTCPLVEAGGGAAGGKTAGPLPHVKALGRSDGHDVTSCWDANVLAAHQVSRRTHGSQRWRLSVFHPPHR